MKLKYISTMRKIACSTMIVAGLATGMAHADTIKVAMTGDLRSLDFGVNRDGNTDTVLHHVVEGLVGYRSDLSVGPLLAKSWEVSDDGTQYTFTLRDGAKFHNGDTVNAEDVVRSWERLLHEDTGFLCRRWFDGSGNTGINIADIEALDDTRVKFTLEEANALFLPRMAHMVCLSGIVHEDSVGPDGKITNLIGTGPFTIGEQRTGQYVELNRFEDYVPVDAPLDGYSGDRTAFVDTARFVVVADSAAAKVALFAGDIDILPRLDLNVIPEAEALPNVEVQTVSTPEWEVMLLQNTDTLLANPLIRQAIALSIDRNGLTEGVTLGLGAPNASAVWPGGEFYKESFGKGLGYDPERAAALLEEGGYNGEKIEIITNPRYPFDQVSAIAIQSMLQSAGLNAEVTVLDWSTQYSRYQEGSFQAMIMGFSARTDPTMMMDVVVGSKEDRGSAIVDAPEIIDLVRKSGATMDYDQRLDLLGQATSAMAEDASIIGLFNPVRAVGIQDRIDGYELWPLEKVRLWGVKISD